ncbi:MAG: fibronectin type III domain-containing protein, partial [Gammaproteobacteria bacterium]|nr:fibronectin type III domain-containing protein [Gammaproteobacteria bacterium]
VSSSDPTDTTLGSAIILHPSGADTDNTVSSYTGGTAASVYDSNDSDTSYGTSTGTTEDYYLQIDDNAVQVGTINSVTVKAYVRSVSGAWVNFSLGVKTYGSTDTVAAAGLNNTTYQLRTQAYANNPVTTSAWSWDEINDIVAIIDHTDADDIRISEIWIEIDYNPTDSIAPNDISDFTAGSPLETSIPLTWTAPGDDGSSGTATTYDIRYSTADITNDTDFNNATQASGEPAPSVAGSNESFTLTGLQSNTSYYVAIKTRDEVPNVSTNFDKVGPITTASIDLSLDASASDLNPLEGSAVTITLTLGNASGLLNATNVSVTDVLPAGLSYVSNIPSQGSYNSGSGVWTVGTVNSGSSVTLQITANVEAVGSYFYSAEVTASDQADGDSVANNAITTEDDYDNINFVPIDNIPPAAITLATGALTDSTIELTWTATGDSGSVGNATSYDIRYSTSIINDATTWNAATQVVGEPTPATQGSGESFIVTGLTAATTYYFAIKAADEAPNWSSLSNSPNATTDAGDTDAPGAVTDLSTSGIPTSNAIIITWSAPGDNPSDGAATSYDIRYSSGGAINDGNWAAATQATGEPTPQTYGTTETFTVTGLTPGTAYWFAMKATDEAANTSIISNSPTATTASTGTIVKLHPSGTSAGDASTYTANGYTAADALDVHDGDYSYGRSLDNGDDYYLAIDDTAGSYSGTINSVTVKAILYSEAGTVNFDIGMDVGGTTSFAATQTHANTNYTQKNGDSLTVQPDSSAWTWAAVDSLIAIVNHQTDTNNMRITELWIEVDYEPGDTTAPNAITDLSASTVDHNNIELTWTAPGDDAASGTASLYDVRYSTAPINNDTDFNNATQASGEPSPSPASSIENFIVTGLDPSTQYYFAVKVRDEIPNTSALSNTPISATTDNAPIIITGTVFSDEGITDVGLNKTVHMYINGVDQGTAETNADGLYLFNVYVQSGDAVLVYVDG